MTTLATVRPGARLHIDLSPGAAAKCVAALVLGAVGVYLLHVGNRERDLRRLSLSVVFVLGALAVFSL